MKRNEELDKKQKKEERRRRKEEEEEEGVSQLTTFDCRKFVSTGPATLINATSDVTTSLLHLTPRTRLPELQGLKAINCFAAETDSSC